MMLTVGYEFYQGQRLRTGSQLVLHQTLIATLQFPQVSLLDADSLVYLTSQVTCRSYSVNVSVA